MQARIVHHYLGANPHSFLPVLRLDVDGDHSQLSDLIQSPAAFAQALGESAPAKRFHNSLGFENLQSPKQGAGWVAHWFDSLLRWTSLVQIDQIISSCQQDPSEPSRFKQSLLINCFRDDHHWFLSLLSWSNDCWSFVVSQHRDPRQAADLQKRFLSLRRAPVKDSFVAMARHLAKQKTPFFISYLNDNHWLHAGLGCRLRQFSQKMTSKTCVYGLQKAKDKQLTRKTLFEIGLPIAAGGVVTSLEGARRLSQRIGYPVVLKPVAQDQGIGVVTLISDENQLLQAWSVAGQHGPRVLVEKHIAGRDFRFLLVNGRLIASLERIPGGVVGDGVSCVRHLIDQENQRRALHPIRAEAGLELRLRPLALDDEALAMLSKQGLNDASIPQCDQVIRLRYTANFSSGGSVRECGSEIHPFNVFLLEKAVSAFQLDIAGLDVIAESLEEPLPMSGGVICEINGMPGVVPHQLAEPSRALMAEVSDMLLDSVPTVPIVMVHGRGSGSFIKRLEEQVLPSQPRLITASRNGLSQSGHLLHQIDASLIGVQLNALQDPSATAFLLELNGKQLAAHGVASPKIDLLVLGDTADDPIPQEVRTWLFTYASEVLEVDDLETFGPETSGSLALKMAAQVLEQF